MPQDGTRPVRHPDSGGRRGGQSSHRDGALGRRPPGCRVPDPPPPKSRAEASRPPPDAQPRPHPPGGQPKTLAGIGAARAAQSLVPAAPGLRIGTGRPPAGYGSDPRRRHQARAPQTGGKQGRGHRHNTIPKQHLNHMARTGCRAIGDADIRAPAGELNRVLVFPDDPHPGTVGKVRQPGQKPQLPDRGDDGKYGLRAGYGCFQMCCGFGPFGECARHARE